MQLRGPIQLNGYELGYGSASGPVEVTWKDEREQSGRIQQNRAGTKRYVGPPRWRGTIRFTLNGMTYKEAAQLLYRLGSGTALLVPRTSTGDDDISFTNDFGTPITLTEVELPVRLVSDVQASNRIQRSDNTQPYASQQVEFETRQVYTSIPGFSTPETFSFRVNKSSTQNVETKVFGPARSSVLSWTVQDLISGDIIEVQEQTDFDFNGWFGSGQYRVTCALAADNLLGIDEIYCFAGGDDIWNTNDTPWHDNATVSKTFREDICISTVSTSDPRLQHTELTVDTRFMPSGFQNETAIPLVTGLQYDIEIDWGDSTTTRFDDTAPALAIPNPNYDPNQYGSDEYFGFGGMSPITHGYQGSGAQTIRVAGKLPRLAYADQPDTYDNQLINEQVISAKSSLVAINQWHSRAWTDYEKSFEGCANLITTGAEVFYDGADWVTNGLIDGYRPEPESMASTFRLCVKYGAAADIDIQLWDTGSLTSLTRTFDGADAFNEDLSAWDWRQVQNTKYMFFGADAYDNGGAAFTVNTTSDLISTYGMFNRAAVFNQPITMDVSGVTNARRMFRRANIFNQNLSSLSFADGVNLKEAFFDADAFNNGDPGNNGAEPLLWDDFLIGNLSRAFSKASSFNQDISSFQMGQCTNLSETFARTPVFNLGEQPGEPKTTDGQPLAADRSNLFSWDWDTSNVTRWAGQRGIFNRAGAFNQDIRTWDFSAGTLNFQRAFSNASTFNLGLPAGEEHPGGWTIDASGMTGDWRWPGVGIFAFCTNFNQDISGWILPQDVLLAETFRGCSNFDQDLGDWDISDKQSLRFFFMNSGMSDANASATLKGWVDPTRPHGNSYQDILNALNASGQLGFGNFYIGSGITLDSDALAIAIDFRDAGHTISGIANPSY